LVLAVAVAPAMVLAALLLEDDDLRPAALLDDLGGHRGTRYMGRADGCGLALAHHQHLLEGHCGTGLAGQLLDHDDLILGDFILLAAGLDDCVHDGFFVCCATNNGPRSCPRGRAGAL
jgi:hypothetical protein